MLRSTAPCARRLAAVTLAFGLLATLAQAGTLKVPAQFPTIQAAVDSAVPGDKIIVAAGVYSENVIVPGGLDGLTLQGAGSKTILDARPLGANGSGDGIGVNGSNNVTIRGFTVRNAASGGSVPFNGGLGINVMGDGALIDKCIVAGNESYGIFVTGQGARILGCQLNGNEGGIELSGDDALITKCTVDNDDYQGCGITGAHGTISSCRVSNVATYGVWIYGNADSLISNVVDDGGEYPLWVGGDEPTVLKNTVTGGKWKQTGLYLDGGTGGLVTGNKFINVSGNALYIYAQTGLVVEKNVVTSCAVNDLAAIYVYASGNSFIGNTVTGSGFDAIQVFGANNSFSGNKIGATAGIGIYVLSGSSGTLLDGNTVLNGTTEGLWNDGTATTAQHNTFTGNRLDVTSNVAFAAFTANTFTTGGESTPPEF